MGLSQTATTQHRPTTDASESAKPVMSDITKPKAKDCSYTSRSHASASCADLSFACCRTNSGAAEAVAADSRREGVVADQEGGGTGAGKARGRTGTLEYEALQLEGSLGTQEEGRRPAAAARRRHARQLSHRRFVGEG